MEGKCFYLLEEIPDYKIEGKKRPMDLNQKWKMCFDSFAVLAGFPFLKKALLKASGGETSMVEEIA